MFAPLLRHGYVGHRMCFPLLTCYVLFHCTCPVCHQVWHMLALRAVQGAMVGGAVPIMYSIFSDLYPSSKRSMISAVVATASGGGTLLGQVCGGGGGG